MGRHRKTAKTLTGSRIYVKRGKFWYFAAEPILDHRTGKVRKWHLLCPVTEGELAARNALAKLLQFVEMPKGPGDFCVWFGKWRTEIISKRDREAPRDPVRADIWTKGSKALLSVLHVIEDAFADFDVVQIAPSHIAEFVDQWEGRRAAQSYRGHLSKFFAWCCRKGITDANPAREVTVVTPKKRKVYVSNEQYVAVRAALLKMGDHNHTMVACLMDLHYLIYQRSTDVRLLRSNDLDREYLEVTPTKTETSSQAKVAIPITDEIHAVVATLKSIAKLRSIYLIHDEHGQPFSARKAHDIFKSACKTVGITGITLKDIRSKAASDAKDLGFTEGQIQIALAHTDGATTRDYIRGRKAPVSEVVLKLPK